MPRIFFFRNCVGWKSDERNSAGDLVKVFLRPRAFDSERNITFVALRV